MKLKSAGSFIKVAVLEFGNWLEAVKQIPVEDLKDVPEDELKSQFKLYLSRLEELTRKYFMDDLHKLDSKIL